MPSQSLKSINLFYSLIVFVEMPTKRKKPSLLKKKLVLIDSVSQFNKIQSDESKRKRKKESHSQSDVTEQVKSQKNDQNQEIILIPHWGKVQNYKLQFCSHRPKGPNQPINKLSYFCLRQSHNLPNPFTYQLTQKDYSFLTYIIRKYAITATAQFYQLFIQMILRNEAYYYKNPKDLANFNNENLRKQIATTLDSIKINRSQQDELFTNNYAAFLYEMYCYWRFIRAERDGFPLVRGYWRNTLSKQDYLGRMVPFKSRLQVKRQHSYKSCELKYLGIKSPYKQNKHKDKVREQSQDARKICFEEETEKFMELWRVNSQQKKEFIQGVNKFHHFAQNYGFGQVVGDLSDSIKNRPCLTSRTEKKIQIRQDVKEDESGSTLINNEQTGDDCQTQQQLYKVKVASYLYNIKRECPIETFEKDNSSNDTIYEEEPNEGRKKKYMKSYREKSIKRKKEDVEAFERSSGMKRVKTK